MIKLFCFVGICGISLLVVDATRATTISALPFKGSVTDDEMVAQVTVMSARLHEYTYQDEIRTCGTSYELMVNETVRGELPKRLLVADTIYLSSETELGAGRMQRSLGIGDRRLVTLKETGEHRSRKDYGDRPMIRTAGGKEQADDLPGWKQGAADACLAELPSILLGFALRIEASATAGDSRNDDLYVLLPSNWWVDDKLISGASAKFLFRTVSTIDPAASYLTSFGSTSPAELTELGFQPPYLQQVNDDGYQSFDQIIPYSDMKRIIRDGASGPP